jgi:hypothetical protein
MRTIRRKWLRDLGFALLLSMGIALPAAGAERTPVQPAERAEQAAQPAQQPRTVPFQSEKTDSWLCNYVSPFFCNLIPTVTVTNPPQNSNSKSSERGRH